MPEAVAPTDPTAPARPDPPLGGALDGAPLLVEGWRDRAADVLARARLSPLRVAAVAVVVVTAVLGYRVLTAPAAAPEVSLPMASTTTARGGASTAIASTSTTAAPVVVDLAGAVVKPGVYRLPPGARVADVVAAAGGLAPGADADRVNLAAPLFDGQEVYVPRVGESGPLPGSTSGAATGGGTAGAAAVSADHPLDLNRATVDDLDLLPGVGPATAQAIVDYRTAHGPFRSVDDLLDVRGIGDAKLAEIRPLVHV